MRVFLSYRREDSSGHSGRLHDALLERLGPKSVFQDVANIKPGQDFVNAIEEALEDCDAVLVVVGPEWLGTTGPDGQARIKEPDDYVRLELATALSSSVPVVPVLVGGANLPGSDELPDDIARFAHRQAVVLHDETWHLDVEGLVRSLRGEPQVSPPRRRWLAVAVTGGAAVVAVAGWLLWTTGDGADNGGSELAVCLDPAGSQSMALELDGDSVGEIAQDGGTLQVTVESGVYRQLAPGSWEVVLNTALQNLTASAQYHAGWHYAGLAVDGRPFMPTCFVPERVLDPNLTTDAKVGFEVDRDPRGVLALLLQDGDAIDLTS